MVEGTCAGGRTYQYLIFRRRPLMDESGDGPATCAQCTSPSSNPHRHPEPLETVSLVYEMTALRYIRHIVYHHGE